MDSVAAGTADSQVVTLCVANLPSETTEEDLRDLFSEYGYVERVRLFPPAEAADVQGFGYVDLCCNRPDAAIKGVDRQEFNGATLHVNDVSGKSLNADFLLDRPNTSASYQDDARPTVLQRAHYTVESVDEVSMPGTGDESDWYCYVLVSGTSRITGFHRGSSREEVMTYAEQCAEDCNERSAHGKSYQTMHSPKRKR